MKERKGRESNPGVYPVRSHPPMVPSLEYANMRSAPMNPRLVALTIPFEASGEDEAGEYAPTGEVPVHVMTDGEAVVFTLPDGTRWLCDREPLQAVVR